MLLLWCIRSLVNCLTSNSSSQVALNSCRNAFTMVSNFFCLALLVDLKRCRSFMTIFAFKFLHKKWGVGIWSDYEYWFVLFDLITLGCEPRLVCDCIRDFPGSACQASLWCWSPGMERHTATRHESLIVYVKHSISSLLIMITPLETAGLHQAQYLAWCIVPPCSSLKSITPQHFQVLEDIECVTQRVTTHGWAGETPP